MLYCLRSAYNIVEAAIEKGRSFIKIRNDNELTGEYSKSKQNVYVKRIPLQAI